MIILHDRANFFWVFLASWVERWPHLENYWSYETHIQAWKTKAKKVSRGFHSYLQILVSDLFILCQQITKSMKDFISKVLRLTFVTKTCKKLNKESTCLNWKALPQFNPYLLTQHYQLWTRVRWVCCETITTNMLGVSKIKRRGEFWSRNRRWWRFPWRVCIWSTVGSHTLCGSMDPRSWCIVPVWKTALFYNCQISLHIEPISDVAVRLSPGFEIRYFHDCQPRCRIFNLIWY